MRDQDLEDLLSESDKLLDDAMQVKPPEDNCKEPHGGKAVNMQRAKKGASLYDFLDMVAVIVDYAMADMKVKFVTDEEENKIKDPSLDFGNPCISYRVISRKPSNEYKPIIREEIVECDEHNEQRLGTVRGMNFDCIVQFNIFASENRVANKVMETFEELMIAYAGYFMEQGVKQVYFKEQIKDTDYNNFRDTLSVRNIRFYVEIEKLMVIFNRRISDTVVFGDVLENRKNNNKPI